MHHEIVVGVILAVLTAGDRVRGRVRMVDRDLDEFLFPDRFVGCEDAS